MQKRMLLKQLRAYEAAHQIPKNYRDSSSSCFIDVYAKPMRDLGELSLVEQPLKLGRMLPSRESAMRTVIWV